MATLSEHVTAIRAAIKAATDDGFKLALEDRDDYEATYVDLEEHDSEGHLLDWDWVIEKFDR